MKLFRGNLFNRKTLAAAVQAAAIAPTEDQREAAAHWVDQAGFAFGGANESQIEQEFNRHIVQRLLGYRPRGPAAPGTMQVKQPLGPGTVDLALGRFDAGDAQVAAPFELKGPRTDLDRIMPGRHKTPVQQAWEYANDARGARWVLVSNMLVVRLYAIGHGRDAYEEFDLRALADPDELTRILLLLHADRLLGPGTADLLARSASQDRDITNQLYRDYRALRLALLQFLADQRPRIDAETRIAAVQKLLDRLTFIAYAEDTVLLPDNVLATELAREDPLFPRPKWDRARALFAAVDQGAPLARIAAYNGGLFAPDPVIDSLDLPDHLVADFLKLSAYDYRSEVSVTVLGHLFEQTVADIEADLLVARGEAPPKADKRKRDGIVYTPDFVTRFIVEQTVGRHIAEWSADLLAVHSDGADADGNTRWRGAEAAYWRELLARIRALTVLDPACGSGHFLIAAFDHLSAAQARIRARLRELDPAALIESDDYANREIITKNLFGVDLNRESVEITRLSLWLKTARRDAPLDSLDANIRVGNSVIEDSDFHSRAFVWRDAFPEITAAGGFDIVVGNPPYVRMELLKPIKPYLEKRYAVVSDRADLYAYFFELGVRLLKPGGRLGYISSATFFRTGSGAPLREWLLGAADLEAVIDFGDAQLFEGVTTYPAVLTMRRRAPGAPPAGQAEFLNLKSVPADLGKAWEEGRRPMPQARLGRAGWRFEGDALAELRARMAAGRKTLAEAHSAPLYGIKTGLNEAFVLTRAQRDALVAADARSADLLKPFLVGENLKRWHVDGDDLHLIYTPKNRVDIDAYPAVRDHLAPFKARLEARATKQNWWELQQAQAAYADHFAAPKVIWPHFQDQPAFSFETDGASLNNKAFFFPAKTPLLAAQLNSPAIWMLLSQIARMKRGGYLEAEAQYVGALPALDWNGEQADVERLAANAAEAAASRLALIQQVRNRLADLHPSIPGIAAFRAWPALSFADLRALLAKRCRTDIPVAERDAWDRYLADRRAEHAALSTRIADAETEINARVNRLFALTPDDAKLIDDALAGQY